MRGEKPDSLLKFAASKIFIFPLLIILTVFFTQKWTISGDHYFYADDWGWLYRAEFCPYSQLFSLLPLQIYNDRPVGAVIIKFIYSLFGLNNVAFHSIYLLIHMVNTLIVYSITKKIFKSLELGFISALLFGNYLIALTAVTWVAAIFDLFCNTLLLLSLYLYLRDETYFKILSVLTYFLAVRTKEMAMFFPVFLMIYEFSRNDNKRTFSEILKKQILYYILMILIGLRYLFLFMYGAVKIPPGDPYYQSISPVDFYKGLEFYTVSLFHFIKIPYIITPLFICMVLWAFVTGKREIIFPSLVFIISLLPVIFLKNHRDLLYLYIPLFYFIIAVVGLMKTALETFSCKENKEITHRRILTVFIILSFIFVILLSFSGFNRKRVAFMIEHSVIYKNNMEYMKRAFPNPRANTEFFIAGLPDYFNVFDYGPGYCLKVLYRDNSIKCIIYKPDAELKELYMKSAGPKYFLKYENGKLYEVNDIK